MHDAAGDAKADDGNTLWSPCAAYLPTYLPLLLITPLQATKEEYCMGKS